MLIRRLVAGLLVLLAGLSEQMWPVTQGTVVLRHPRDLAVLAVAMSGYIR